MNLNPNHPISRSVSGKWHKIAALIMHKLKVTHLEITEEDVESFLKSNCCNIGIGDDKGYMEISLLNPEQSAAALKKYGGTPDLS